jgi:hypothetical protein
VADIPGWKGHEQLVEILYYNCQAEVELAFVDQGRRLDREQSFDTLSAGKDAL